MKRNHRRRWMLAALALCAGAATAAPPPQILITRELQDLYRASSGGTFYIKTIGCHEHVYADRAGLRLNLSTRGGVLIFRNGRSCVVDKFLNEIEPSKLNLKKEF